jgi:outer membrane receptor protein involved in Fe transport
MTVRQKWLPMVMIGCILVPGAAMASTTGKVVGTVRDAETGEPLPYANVMVEGTTLGAVTDLEGYYFILNVPPGPRSIKVQMMGYTTKVAEGVAVVPDRTARADFLLDQTVIDMGVEVRVVAERPMIHRDATSKVMATTRREIEHMPVEGLDEVIALQSGTTTDASGDLHIRGGRAGEMIYVVDGLVMKEPFHGGQATLLNVDAVEEMVMVSGTFNAEYGDAMSGVVNVVTREGSEAYQSTLRYQSPSLLSSPYRKKDWISSGSDVKRDAQADTSLYVPRDIRDITDPLIPSLGEWSGTLSGPVPGLRRMRFFLAGRYLNENSYLPNGYTLERDLHARLTTQVRPNIKLGTSAQWSRQMRQDYRHGWKYRPDHQAHENETATRVSLDWTHSLNARLFYEIGFGRLQRRDTLRTDDKEFDDLYERWHYDDDREFYLGDDPRFRIGEAITWSVRGSATFQATDQHQLKAGMEFRQHDLRLRERNQFYIDGEVVTQRYHLRPQEAFVYIQDKLEYDYLIVNAGIRYDWAQPHATGWQDPQDPTSPLVDASSKGQLSPRIGLAHPITERSVLHFSYGHFFQNPPYHALFYNRGGLNPDSLVANSLVGNPDVHAQKTVMYEAGIQHQISRDWALDLSAYHKDVYDLLATTSVREFPYLYAIYSNADFARVQGIDVSLRRRITERMGMTVNYSYMEAKGNRSFPLQGFWDFFTGQPEAKQEYTLDFDRTHDLSVSADLRWPCDAEQRWLAGTGFHLLIQVASGLPYTPYVGPGLIAVPNSARKPWTGTVDLNVFREIYVGRLLLTLFGEVTNLLDRKNALWVYSRTGKPWDAGWEGLGTSPDAVMDPSNVDRRREVRIGASMEW